MNNLITIKNVSKSFNGVYLFNNINLEIKETGIYGLIGFSGSGKTTLLMMLGLIDNEYEGDIYYKNQNIKTINNKEEFIFNHIGFVFQNPVLFSDLTLYENLLMTKSIEEDYINELLLKLDLFSKKKTLAKNLSGGERIRLSIVRALLNNPELLILDEPTASLDEYNSKLIMDLLKEESKKRAIFMVSHNVKLLENYVHYLYILKNKTITNVTNNKPKSIKIKSKKTHKNKLLFSFIYKYVFINFKRKKLKSYIFVFSLFLSMFVVGFSIILTHDVSNMVVDSLNSLTDDNQIIMKGKVDSGTKLEEISSSEEDALYVIENSSYFYDYGYVYSSNFEQQFCDNNYLEIVNGGYTFYEVGARDISETINIDDIDSFYKFYPYKPNYLENNEIVLGLKKTNVKNICKSLVLDNLDEASLSNYIQNNDLLIKFKFTNLSWNYDVEIPLKLKAFFIYSDDIVLAHTNENFVSYIFEDVMKLPVSSNMSIIDLYPWTIKKQLYLKVDELDIPLAIEEYLKSEYYEKYDLKILKGNIHSSTFSSSFHKGKFLMSYASIGKVSYSSVKKLIDESYVDNIFPTGLFYEVIENALVSGFTNSIFVSSNEERLNEVGYYFNDLDENIDTLDISKYDLGTVSYGNLITSALKKGVKLTSTYENIVCGKLPVNNDEVMISSGLAKKLFSSIEDTLNKKLYFMINNYNYEDGNNFTSTYVTITGIFDDDKERIYQTDYWYPIFLVLKLNYSLEKIQINKFLITSSYDFETLNSIDENVEFINPFIDVLDSVDDMIKMINIILSIFSILLTISSFGVAFISIQASMKEASKEIGLFKTIGISKKSIFILYFLYNIINFVFAYLLAFFNLYLSSKVISCIYFNLPFSFSIYLKPFIIMFILGIIEILPLTLIYTSLPIFTKSNKLLKRYY